MANEPLSTGQLPSTAATADPMTAAQPPIPGVPVPTAQKPDAYANLQRQIEIFTEVKKQATEGRTVYERGWWRILMYLLLRQWIYYDTKRSQWRDKRLAKWMPRPTNSKMNQIQQTLRSMFASIDLGAIARPNGEDPLNQTTAEVVDALEPVLGSEHKIDNAFSDADFWLTALGNVILHPWWDSEEGDTIQIPASQCADCGLAHPPGTVDLSHPICQGCQSPNVAAMPGTEAPVPVGKGRTDVCSSLEILVPGGYTDWDDVREIIRARWRTKSYYVAHYPELVERIEWQKTPQERSIQLLKALASQSDLTATPFMTGGADMTDNEGVVEYELWIKPTQEFPEGYIGRFIGEGDDPIVLQRPEESLPGPLPYRDRNGKPLWNWIHIGYDTFGGRLWSRGPMEGVVPLIDKINRLDARIELIVDRMSNPIWLEPKGAEVERLTGEPGIIVRYQSFGNSGMGKPERVDGSSIPPGLFTLRQQYEAEIQDAAGTHDVLQGERPPNVDTFSGMQLLAEQGLKRFTSVFKARGRAYQDWYKIAIEMERQFGPAERVLATLGPNRKWVFETFKKADLNGSIAIIVEDGSTTPKTALGKRAAIDHAVQMKALNPTDPNTNFAVMSHLGLKDLVPQVDKAVSAVLREQYLYERWVEGGRQGGPCPLVRLDYIDNDPIHVQQHQMWAMSDAIHDLMLTDPQAMQEIQMHVYAHENGIFQKQMLQATAAAGHPQPGPAGAPGAPGAGAHPGAAAGPGNGAKPSPGVGGGANAMTSSNRESGDPRDAGGRQPVPAAA